MRLLGFCLAALLAGGCGLVDVTTQHVVNHSSATIEIYVVVQSDELFVGAIPQDLTLPLNGVDGPNCSTHVLVARNTSGLEVARRTEPLCPDDTWVIRDP
jgi:hypothetical protein